VARVVWSTACGVDHRKPAEGNGRHTFGGDVRGPVLDIERSAAVGKESELTFLGFEIQTGGIDAGAVLSRHGTRLVTAEGQGLGRAFA
jgi:hypothetical protein